MTVITITITEALAELKTLRARIEKKRQAIAPYICRDSRLLDPISGAGSKEFVQSELQAIDDLFERIIKVRSAIAAKNSTVLLSVAGQSRTVQDWLIWKREVATERKNSLEGLRQQITGLRQQLPKVKAQAEAEGASPAMIPNLVVNLDEKALSSELEKLEAQLGELDGKLSLNNAQVSISI